MNRCNEDNAIILQWEMDAVSSSQHKQTLRLPLRPSCFITTCLRIHSTQPMHNESVLSPNLQLKEQPGCLCFHSFHKYNSYDYHFDHILRPGTATTNIAFNTPLTHSLLSQTKDFCLLAIGGPHSGLAQLCQGEGQEGGLFSLLLIDLMKSIIAKTEEEGKEERSRSQSNSQLGLRFLVVCDTKVYDLLNSKNIVSLQ